MWAVVVIQYIGEAKGQHQKYTSYKEDKFKFIVNTFFHKKLFITPRKVGNPYTLKAVKKQQKSNDDKKHDRFSEHCLLMKIL